jgi:HK97 family phage portal protein
MATLLAKTAKKVLVLWWNRKAPVEERSFSIGDPAVAELLGMGLPNLAGVSVNEHSALGLSAVYRAVSLIAGSIASLPMRTLQNRGDQTERAKSFFDTPGGPNGLTAYEWKETVLAHLLLHGNAFLAHIYGGAGQLVGMQPLHPLCVTVECYPDVGKTFKVSLNDGTIREFNQNTMTHIMALSTDGICGLSPITMARNSFGTSIAGERSAARMFANGALVSGLVTPEDDLTEAEAKTIKDSLRQKMLGESNAGDIAVINRKLKFTQWSMNAADAQWIESRAFQIEEIGRWYGVPPHLLGQTDKQTSWGTGVSEQNRGLARYTLTPWSTRIEERLSRLLPPSRKVEFDYTAFVKPSPEDEITLLIAQVQAGLITVDEARSIRNMPPLPKTEAPSSTVSDQNDGGGVDG